LKVETNGFRKKDRFGAAVGFDGTVVRNLLKQCEKRNCLCQ
jgi:hypothetical protein